MLMALAHSCFLCFLFGGKKAPNISLRNINRYKEGIAGVPIYLSFFRFVF